jgi:hypothetical protein
MTEAIPLDDETLAAYVDGALPADEREDVDRRLREDPNARARLAELYRVRTVLSGNVPELDDIDLLPSIRERLSTPARSLSGRSKVALYAGGLAAAAAALVSIGVRGPDEDAEFRAKGNALAVAAAERWTGVRIYRVRDGHKAEPASERVSPRDGLMFSYTNRADDPFDYLMIFGVGATGEVHWFYPAYERLGQNPRSVTIARGTVEQSLGEVVRHELQPGTLAVHALFTREPLAVLDVEAWVRERRAGGERALPAVGANLQVVKLGVEP